MRRPTNVGVSHKKLIVEYDDGSIREKDYNIKTHVSLVKEAIIYHQEKLKQHEREGLKLYEQLRTL